MTAKRLAAFIAAAFMLVLLVPVRAGEAFRGADDYYSENGYPVDVLLSESGWQLANDLNDLMTTTHTHVTSYSEIRYMFTGSDADPDVPGNILLCYSGASVNGTWDQGATYNREHVWPKSHGSFSDGNAGADLHHIRPENQQVNSDRGNYLMSWVDTATKQLAYNNSPIGSYVNTVSGTFEPRDGFKGDVARIYFYVAVRWGEDLAQPVSDDTFATLLEWSILDPVDGLERARNDYVESVQGDRNVFIDHPEFGRLIYGSAENGFDYVPLTSGDYSYYEKDGGAVILSYSGSMAELVIPEALGGLPVTGLGCAAFANHPELTSVTLPSGVSSVGAYAFFNDTALQCVYVPGRVIFERRAFRACPALSGLYFSGEAPEFLDEGSDQIMVSGSDNASAPEGFTLYYVEGQPGWAGGSWSSGAHTYPAAVWDGSASATPGPVLNMPGDVNCDGSVTMADLSALSAYILGKGSISPQGLANADVDNNGTANVMDMPMIYQLTLISL